MNGCIALNVTGDEPTTCERVNRLVSTFEGFHRRVHTGEWEYCTFDFDDYGI